MAMTITMAMIINMAMVSHLEKRGPTGEVHRGYIFLFIAFMATSLAATSCAMP